MFLAPQRPISPAPYRTYTTLAVSYYPVIRGFIYLIVSYSCSVEIYVQPSGKRGKQAVGGGIDEGYDPKPTIPVKVHRKKKLNKLITTPEYVPRSIVMQGYF